METWPTPHEERVDRIHVVVTVPGTEFQAELRHRDQISVSFGRGRYPYLAERDLEHYLAALGRLLLAVWRREYLATLDDVLRDGWGSRTEQDRGYLAAREQIESRGTSADGRVTITARGLRDARVSITPGTLRALGEREFSDDVRQAAAAIIQDHLRQIAELKRRYYP